MSTYHDQTRSQIVQKRLLLQVFFVVRVSRVPCTVEQKRGRVKNGIQRHDPGRGLNIIV